MNTRLRTVYVLREQQADARDTGPSVRIDLTASGTVTCGIKATGRSLAQARRRAETEFRALMRFTQEMTREKKNGRANDTTGDE